MKVYAVWCVEKQIYVDGTAPFVYRENGRYRIYTNLSTAKANITRAMKYSNFYTHSANCTYEIHTFGLQLEDKKRYG